MHRFKSAFLEKLKVHEIWNFFLANSILLKHYEIANKIKSCPPSPGFMQEKVQKGIF